MSMKTNAFISAAFAPLVLTAMAGCGETSEAPMASTVVASLPNAASQEEPASASASFVSEDEDLRLNDEFVSPDADSPAVADEDAPAEPDEDEMGEEEALTDAIDPLADADSPTAIEMKFVPASTTNIFVSGRQFSYAHEIAKRNERIRMNRQEAQAKEASVAADTNAPATASTPIVSNASPPVAVQAASSSSTAPAAQPSASAPPPIDEKKILEEKQGQWAASANASSMYGRSTVPTSCPRQCPKSAYSPWQVTGAPNVGRYSDSPSAWTTKSGDAKEPEWLEVGFAKPVHATSIRIRQSAAPGAIARIELLDEAKVAHTIWEGTDDTPYAKNTIGWLVKDFPRTTYRITGARITLMTARVWGWNEIDAVQAVGEE